jgi:hypothetical protein
MLCVYDRPVALLGCMCVDLSSEIELKCVGASVAFAGCISLSQA